MNDVETSARDPWLPDLNQLRRPQNGRKRSCESKRRYADKRAAVSELNRLARTGRESARKLRPYACRHCGGWHLTHKEDER